MTCEIHLRAISQEMFKVSIHDMNLKITNLRLQMYLPGANELIYGKDIYTLHMKSQYTGP